MITSQRLFIAIKPSDEVLEAIKNYRENYLRHPAFRITEKENLHLTITFLGYTKKEEIPTIIEVLKNLSQKYKPFEIQFDFFNYGPNPKSPRLIWLEGKAPSELLSLKKDLEQELEKNKILFNKEKRDFKVHITVARIKKDNKLPLPPAKDIQKKVNLNNLKFLANSLILMESHLKPTGAQYSELKVFDFKN
ncbi:MAG TPA: RNA 2',3'-cyclic phosphodiesterase [Candidatus Paceibacterota bacterium]|nr:RNA 2',3'-cyclic phosphodiesterase [Candidatus Paceibacterota bacterium]